MNFLLHFLATLLVFLLLDVVWLKFLIGGLVEYPFVTRYGYPPNWALAEIYYVLFSLWLAFGAAYKSMVYNNLAPAFLDGWRVGFRVGALYAAVNIVFVAPWPLELVVLDVAWVTLSTALAAVASYAIGLWLTSGGSQVRRR
ncbi:MAG: DUF2177 family protein [Saprospiraceae bacterium]|nr:DUF2177 family protein [Saprospiraceae bacterium]